MAQENELCPGYYTWDLLNAMRLCGAIPIVITAAGLPDYEAEVGPFPLVNASRAGWLVEVRRRRRNACVHACTHARMHTGRQAGRQAGMPASRRAGRPS